MKTIADVKRVLVDATVADGLLARSVRERLPAGTEWTVVEDARAVLEEFRATGNRGGQKDTVLLYRFPGRFVGNCPGSDGMVCCNYMVINFGVGCLFDCSYCYLQNFMNNPLMTLFGNLEDLFAEVRARTRNQNHHFRIGTGEYTDSLALDPLTGLSRLLVDFFADLPNATLELKTKSDNVEELLGLEHRGRTVVSWSLNPPVLSDAVEHDTASIDRRLQAAARVEAAGYRVGFHLDPLVHFEGWEAEYHRLVERIFEHVRPDSVAWISTGSFRYAPGLKEVMQARFPDDPLTRGEMVQGPDGKYRYFRTIRQEMYSSIRRKVGEVDPKLFLYLCMETRHMWDRVFDFVPDSAKNLDAAFEARRLYMEEAGATAAALVAGPPEGGR